MQLRRFGFDQEEQMEAFFEENGFVLISSGIPDQDIQDFRAVLCNVINAFLLKAALPEINGELVFTDGLQALESVDHELVASVYDTIFQTPAFFRIVGSKNIERTVKRLLRIGVDHPLYGFTNRCLIAPPTDERRTYGWHQEVFYTVPRGRYLQTWAPLIFDTTTETGTIEVCPGSHKEGVAKQHWNEIPGRSTQILIDEKIIGMYKPVQVEMKLGELMIFSGHLAHKSGHNSSAKVRYSLVGMYHDVKHKPFNTPKLTFGYRGETPRDYYDAVQKHFV